MTAKENDFVPYQESFAIRALGFDLGIITFYEAFRFFRKKYGLVPVIIPTVNVFWTYKVVRCLEGEVEFPPYKDVCAYDYSTYEGAELECLREMIKMVNENIDKEKS